MGGGFGRIGWWCGRVSRCGLGLGLDGLGVGLGDKLDIEDQLGLGRDGVAACGSVGELIGNEEATLAANAHAVKTGVPAGDDLVAAVGDRDGLAAVDGGVELGAVYEVAGVVDGVPLVRCGKFAGADFGVDIVEGEAGGFDTKGFQKRLRVLNRSDVIKTYGRHGDYGVERPGAGQTGGKRGNFGGERGDLGAGRLGGVRRSGCGVGAGGVSGSGCGGGGRLF